MSKSLKMLAFAGATWAAAGTAAAADPTAYFFTPGFEFVEFLSSGADPIVEIGLHDQADTLFWFGEQENVAGTPYSASAVDSYYVFFDAAAPQDLRVRLTFDRPIVGVIGSDAALDSSVNYYGLPEVSYYGSNAAGLELGKGDWYVVEGNRITLNLRASDPGDHLRILVSAVPEPDSYAMLLAGLGLCGLIARRRLG